MDSRSIIKEDMVKKCLKSDKGDCAVLQSFQVKDFLKKGDNYANLVTSVLVNYKMGGQDVEQSYVVKIRFLDDLPDLKESNFFQYIVPDLNQELKDIGYSTLNIPKIPLITNNDGQLIIFLEDLRQRGFKHVDRKKGLDKDHSLLLIRALAKIHAASVLLQQKINSKEKLSLLSINHSDERAPKFIPYHPIFTGLVGTVSIIAKQMGGYDSVAKYLKSLQPHIIDFFRKCFFSTEEKFAVITHGDCWSNNVMFRYDENGCPQEVMLFDFDIVMVSSVALDLNHIFFTSLSDELRRNKPDTFLRSYFDAFREVLSTTQTEMPFTFEDLKMEFKNLNRYGFLLGLIMISPMMREGGDPFQFNRINEDNVEEILKENEEDLLKLSTNEAVSARFAEIFDMMLASGLVS
ncbi:uncharacterized protein LOC143039969 [Oratosquilla oratoria]|uniref:uncharacterized protein LOC143039969 n=1 Tax=Oratosquilla oratoria TaxID=337810 RepID=UPI003F770269